MFSPDETLLSFLVLISALGLCRLSLLAPLPAADSALLVLLVCTCLLAWVRGKGDFLLLSKLQTWEGSVSLHLRGTGFLVALFSLVVGFLLFLISKSLPFSSPVSWRQQGLLPVPPKLELLSLRDEGSR